MCVPRLHKTTRGDRLRSHAEFKPLALMGHRQGKGNLCSTSRRQTCLHQLPCSGNALADRWSKTRSRGAGSRRFSRFASRHVPWLGPILLPLLASTPEHHVGSVSTQKIRNRRRSWLESPADQGNDSSTPRRESWRRTLGDLGHWNARDLGADQGLARDSPTVTWSDEMPGLGVHFVPAWFVQKGTSVAAF